MTRSSHVGYKGLFRLRASGIEFAKTQTVPGLRHLSNSCLSRNRKGTFQYQLGWSRGVTRWFRWRLAVAGPFVCRCLNSDTMLPSSHPAHRTGRAERPHPALGESVTRSPTGDYSSALEGRRGPTLDRGSASETVPSPFRAPCVWHIATVAAVSEHVHPPPGRLG